MNIKNVIPFFLLLLAVSSLSHAARPSINELNTRVNQLDADVTQLQAEDVILHDRIDQLTPATSSATTIPGKLYPSSCYSAYCPTCTAASGWCPDGVKDQFMIEHAEVTDETVIVFNVVENYVVPLPYHCQVSLVRDGLGLGKIDPSLGEFLIRCATPPTAQARLHFAIIKP